MTYTNEGLVKFVISLMSMPRGTVYILGGIGRALTEHMIQERIKKGCAHTIRNQNTIRAKIGNYAYDCNAIIKCYLWQTAPGVINYNRPVGSDLGSTQLYNLSREKGVMSTMPDIPGLLVWTKDLGHVGVYVGKVNGIRQYIESTPAWNAWGVTTSADKNHPKGHNRQWAFWGKYHLIEYITPPAKPVDPIKAYTIVRGDTLGRLASRFGMSVFDLHNMNKDVIGADPNKIVEGQVIRLDPNVVFVDREVIKEVPTLKELDETIKKDDYTVRVVVSK